MEVRRTTWNELIDLMIDMEQIAELFHSEVDSAYDEDIEVVNIIIINITLYTKGHVRHLRETATNQLEQFREACCNKCRPSSQSLDGVDQQFTESQQGVEEEIHSSNEYPTSPGAIESPQAVSPNLGCGADVPSRAGSYRLNDFKKGMLI